MITTSPTDPLIAASIRVLADGQSRSGAFIASPNFPQYGFAWLRDGAYCALAMDAVGERASSRAFHRWTAGVIDDQRTRILDIVGRLRVGEAFDRVEMLPTRYTLSGQAENEPQDAWPNFQLDGYGTWLFALHSHLGGADPAAYRPAVALAAEYVAASWELPCYDYWEEFGDQRHTSTLAAIAAGLRAASRMLDRPDLDETADAVLHFIQTTCVSGGSFVKGPKDDRLDASLISLATPFGLINELDPTLLATVEGIRTSLASPSGGIRRYLGDSYYGGNPWLLLTSWLGWHDRLQGNAIGHSHARNWVRAHQGHSGWLPEQILDEAQDPSAVQPWVDRWGPVANPLLWSHAKYLLMQSDAGTTRWS
ncbi:MAG TPA: glycoside hydrolase family 15 protein [Dermatophilaceae bacterium]|jgi:GH15 family glucan-1,4-alpha-glucosidase